MMIIRSQFQQCRIKQVLLGLFICSFLTGFGQSAEILAAYKEKYPGNHFVMTKDIHTVRIKLVKNVPVVTSIFETEYLILDKTGVQSMTQESIKFSSFETIDNIKAYALVPNGKNPKKVAATDFTTRDSENDNGIFHDDSKETNFIYPELTEGSVQHLYYESTMSLNTFPFGFNFFSSIPIENPTFIIEADSAIHVFYKTYFTELAGVQFTETIEKGTRISTWTCPGSFRIKKEDNSPSPYYYAPHILAQITHYNTKKGRTNVISNISDLHSTYQKNVAEVLNEEPNGDLKAIADSVTRNCSTELDKVKSIYYWVQDHIKYIAFEEGIGGFVPRQPSKIVEKRYGDCKDMASLMYSMTKSVGIPTYLTWIGSRDIPYKYTDFPSNYCDNHMILTYKNGGKNYFLDATNSFQSMNYPTEFIQGKEALLHIKENEYEVLQLPIAPAEISTMNDYSFIQIRDKKLIGHSTTTASGYYQGIVGRVFKDVPAKDMNKVVASFNEKANNSFFTSNPKLSNTAFRDSTALMEYDWEVSNYVTNLGDAMYVNMILHKDFLIQGEFKADRIAPYEFDFRFDDNYIVELEIPEGYTVKNLPKNAKFDSDFIHFSLNYSMTGNRVTMSLKLKHDFIMLDVAQFQQWNEFIKLKKTVLAESLELIKK